MTCDLPRPADHPADDISRRHAWRVTQDATETATLLRVVVARDRFLMARAAYRRATRDLRAALRHD